MMKKLFIILFILLSCNISFAATEDLSDDTIGGTDSGSLSQTEDRITFTAVDDDDDAYAYDDYTASHFSDFEIKFHVYLGNQQSNSQGSYLILSDTSANNSQELRTAKDGLAIVFKRAGTDGWYLYDYENESTVGTAADSTTGYANRYLKYVRSGSTCTLNIYSSSDFTSDVTGSPISGTCNETEYRYMYPFASGPSWSLASDVSGYIENIEIVSVGDGDGDEDTTRRVYRLQ